MRSEGVVPDTPTCEAKVPSLTRHHLPDSARKWLAKKHPALAPHLPKSLGFSLGLDFKDSAYPLRCVRVDPEPSSEWATSAIA